MSSVIYILWLRNVKKYVRSKSRIIGSTGMPLFFLIIMGFGLNSILNVAGGKSSYIDFIAPGIVMISVLFIGVFVGMQLVMDRQFGFIKETLIAPVSRFTILFGQAIGGATNAFIQGLITLAIALIVIAFTGGRIPTITGILLSFVFMILVGLIASSIGLAIGSKMKDLQAWQLIITFIIFPLFGLSGALFPISTAPAAIRWLSYINPVTYGVEGMRYSFLGFSNIPPGLSLLVLVAFSIFFLLIGGLLFNRMKL